MISTEISKLHDKYGLQPKSSLLTLYKIEWHKRRESLVVLTQATLAGLLGTSGKYFLDVALIPSEVKLAFAEAFPHLELSDLAGKSVNYLDGIEPGWKGKLFEVMVRDKLNAGETIGGITLLEGESATLAEKTNQAGWDIQILDNNGLAIEHLQLKASENLSYIHSALEKYPDISIITTGDHQATEMIFPVKDISDIELETALEGPLEIAQGGLIDGLDFATSFGSFLALRLLFKKGVNNHSTHKLLTIETQKLERLGRA